VECVEGAGGSSSINSPRDRQRNAMEEADEDGSDYNSEASRPPNKNITSGRPTFRGKDDSIIE
jgi:hypothetical protein